MKPSKTKVRKSGGKYAGDCGGVGGRVHCTEPAPSRADRDTGVPTARICLRCGRLEPDVRRGGGSGGGGGGNIVCDGGDGEAW